MSITWAPCSSTGSSTWNAQGLLGMSSFLIDYPFAERLYPQALQVLAHLQTMGETVILSDGDVVFQPRKIQRSGIWDAVDGTGAHLRSQGADAALRRAALSRAALRHDR